MSESKDQDTVHEVCGVGPYGPFNADKLSMHMKSDKFLYGYSRPIPHISYSGFTPDGVLMACACLDGRALLRNGTTGQWIGTFLGHTGAVWSAQLNNSATMLATSSADFSARIWDATSGEEKLRLKHKSVVKTAVFGYRCHELVTGGYEKLVRVWDLQHPWAAAATLKGHKRNVTRVWCIDAKADNDGGSSNKSNNSGGSDQKSVSGVGLSVPPTSALYNGNLLVSYAVGEHGLRVWDKRTGETVRELTCPLNTSDAGNVGAVTLVPQNSNTKSSTSSNAAPKLPSKAPQIEACNLSNWGSYLVAAFAGGVTALYDVARGFECVQVWTNTPRRGKVTCVALSECLSEVVCGSADELWARRFNYRSGRELNALSGHHGHVRCAEFSPTGEIVVTGSQDASVRMWGAEVSHSVTQEKDLQQTSGHLVGGESWLTRVNGAVKSLGTPYVLSEFDKVVTPKTQ